MYLMFYFFIRICGIINLYDFDQVLDKSVLDGELLRMLLFFFYKSYLIDLVALHCIRDTRFSLISIILEQ